MCRRGVGAAIHTVCTYLRTERRAELSETSCLDDGSEAGCHLTDRRRLPAPPSHATGDGQIRYSVLVFISRDSDMEKFRLDRVINAVVPTVR